MILIAHRGNIYGQNRDLENKPKYINQALKLGYDVEIDVWFINGKFFLGHDSPDYSVDISFLKNKNLWCHAKNIKALREMIKVEDIHCFYHNTDDVTLTSKNFLWTYPGRQLTDMSVCVDINRTTLENIDDETYFGLCSDYVGYIK